MKRNKTGATPDPQQFKLNININFIIMTIYIKGTRAQVTRQIEQRKKFFNGQREDWQNSDSGLNYMFITQQLMKLKTQLNITIMTAVNIEQLKMESYQKKQFI